MPAGGWKGRQGIWKGWTGRSGLGLKAPGCHSPVTVPEACGSTGENHLSLSGCPPSVPAELSPPSPTRPAPGRGGRAWVHVRGSVSRGSSTRDQHQLGAQLGRGWKEQFSLEGMQGSSPALGAAHTPYTDVHQRLAVDQTVVQGIHQAHGILLQDH